MGKKSFKLRQARREQEKLTLKRKQMFILGAMISISANRIRKYKAVLKFASLTNEVENRLMFDQFVEGCAF